MPELRAFHPVSTALDRTKKLLFEPFDAWVWLKLIIIMFFVGSGGNSFNPGNALQYMSGDNGNFSGDMLSNSISNLLSDTFLIALIVLLIIAILVLVLFFSYLRSVFSFVLIDVLTTGEAHIIRPFKENMGRGFKVFLFNIVVMVISITAALLMLIVLLLSIFWLVSMDNSDTAGAGMILIAVGVLLLTILAFVAFSVIIGIIVGFFYDFAIPLIRFKNMGLLESIKHVISLVAKEPVEFLVYMLVRWALGAVVGFIFGIIYLCVFAVFLAVGLIVIMLAVAAAKVSMWLVVPFVLIIVLGFALLVILMALISMPVGVYFRYYSLDFLRSFDPGYVPYSGRFAQEYQGQA